MALVQTTKAKVHEFEALPADIYPMEIINVTEDLMSKNHNKYTEVEFKSLKKGEFAGRIAKFRMFQFHLEREGVKLAAALLNKSVDDLADANGNISYDPAKFVGLSCNVQIKNDEYNGKLQNVFADFFPIEGTDNNEGGDVF